MKKQLFFNQLGINRLFHYGNEPDRLFLKVSPTQAVLEIDQNDPTHDDKGHTVNPLTLIFTEDD